MTRKVGFELQETKSKCYITEEYRDETRDVLWEIYPNEEIVDGDGNTHFGLSMLTVTRDLASRIPPRWHTAEIGDESNHEGN